jgi:pyrroline-5-carboxylate reductase
MKLTFIGNGNMAKALIQGLVNTYEIEVLGRNEATLKALQEEIPKITTRLLDNQEDITNKNIILCVKPYSLSDLSKNLIGSANSIYSVLAGTTLESLKESIDAKNYIRTMPNLGAAYQKSMTTITGDEALKETAIKIFDKIGSTLWLSSQKELDIATGVAGSGPAFLALIAESLADGGVNAGLKRADSQALVNGLFDGFAALLENDLPANIKDAVMSPGGTTAAGYAALEKGNVRFAMIDSISAAYNRAQDLKKQ